MSSYNGRRAPNFSQYLEDLNAIPSPFEQSAQQSDFNIDAELALFTNAEFYDFGHFGDLNMPPVSYESSETKTEHQGPTSMDKQQNVDYVDFFNADLNHIPEYPSADFQSSDSQNHFPMSSPFTTVPPVQNATYNTVPPANKSNPVTSRAPPATAPASITTPAPTQTAGTKRKQDPKTMDEAARLAAEEDKRRRNTAASARFRIKKKLREQALERTVKETTEKNAQLEARVSQLELENQWLKNLITEKNGGDLDGQKNEADIAQMFKKFLAQKNERENAANKDSNPATSTTSVGTSTISTSSVGTSTSSA